MAEQKQLILDITYLINKMDLCTLKKAKEIINWIYHNL